MEKECENKNLLVFFCIFIFIILNVFFSDVFLQEALAYGSGEKVKEIKDINTDITTGDNIPNTFKWIFFSIIAFFAWLITFAVSLIEFTLTPQFNEIFKLDALYLGWSTVRDFLNILFIFFLLFSAFSTVFQVSKYHIKSTWVMIVVMACLVNFSWPITRVVIDVSNVAMQQIIGGDAADATGGSLMAKIGKGSGFAATIVGVDVKKENVGGVVTVKMQTTDWVNIFMGILFSFLFMVTVGAIAMILVIRTIAMAVLLVFASVGFTLAAFPSTRSYSSNWWSSLVKYAATGPILLFVLFLSAGIFEELSSNGAYKNAASSAVQKNSFFMAEYMVYATEFIVPIVILWFGIIAAGKLGDGASSMVVGRAKGVANWGKRQTFGRGAKFGSWAGRKTAKETAHLTNSSVRGITRFGAKGLGVKNAKGLDVAAFGQATKERFVNADKARQGKRDDKIAERKAEYMVRGTEIGTKDDSKWYAKATGKVVGYGGDKNAVKNLNSKKAAEMKKKWKDDSVDIGVLTSKLDGAKGVEQRALIEHITSQKDGVGEDQISALVKHLGDGTKLDVGLQKAISKKASETGNVHKLLEHKLKQSGADAKKIFEEDLENMDAKTMTKQTKFFKNIKTDPELGKLGLDLQRRMADNSFKTEFLKQGGGNKTVQEARSGGYITG